MLKKLKQKIKKVILLGSGGIRISQAGEFDYSGSQSIKALKEEKIKIILINPNIATIQTDPQMADEIYLEPLNLKHVSKIIKKEKPDSIILSFGGQTALNLGIELQENKVLSKYNVTILGNSIKTIKETEDRNLFKKKLDKINIKTAKSFSINTVNQAVEISKHFKFPIMIRSGFSLGGLGSTIIKNKKELKNKISNALNNTSQVLIEESLVGWSEFEYEILRDSASNILTICNMENIDPVGIHTGESIVICPSQSLTNEEYHKLRKTAINIANNFNIIGECNIQYAFNLETSEYRVIEINPRLSRSSALASKATGYPLAFIATKLILGYKLPELKNTITKKTCAFFEPALDYIVIKIPRWDTTKLKKAKRTIGTEMKSVGEIMSISRSFPEGLQKAIGMLNIGAEDLNNYPFKLIDIEEKIKNANDIRIFALYKFFIKGGTVKRANNLSKIDKWFLFQISLIAKMKVFLASKKDKISKTLIIDSKKLGFSDKTISKILKVSIKSFRKWRIINKIIPNIKQIDTLAGEYKTETNYLYLTYNSLENDIKPSLNSASLIIGSGPYSIGSSVEFDWCAVNTSQTLKDLGEFPIIINSNPETVSTDYDESYRLYFEILSLERIQDIIEFENLKGIIVSVGGQIANNLVLAIANSGNYIMGTKANYINNAENRAIFSKMLNNLKIDQPEWQTATNLKKIKKFALRVKYPILVRPSYVLSGSAMNVIHSNKQLKKYILKASSISPEHPVVISDFIQDAKELEIDGVGQKGKIIIYAMLEHIENAGIHSGDANIIIPPQNIHFKNIKKIKDITKKIVKNLNVSGPFNIQFIIKNDTIKVIECNLRASRSFPFVSKVTNQNFIRISIEVIFNKYKKTIYTSILKHIGIKTPQFSYNRLKGANPVANVEMSSTGEVGCIGYNLLNTFYKSWQATEINIKRKKIFLSISNEKKSHLTKIILDLSKAEWEFYATFGTFIYLKKKGIKSKLIYRTKKIKKTNIEIAISKKMIDLIINIPNNEKEDQNNNSDGFKIRRLAVDHNIPLITNLQIAIIALKSLAKYYNKPVEVKSWKDFMNKKFI